MATKTNGKEGDLKKQLTLVQKALASKKSTLGQSIARGTDVEVLVGDITDLERREKALEIGIAAFADNVKAEAKASKAKEAEDKRVAEVRERLEANRLEEYRMLVLFLELRDASDDLERQLGMSPRGRVPSVRFDIIGMLKEEARRIFSETPEALGGQHHRSPQEKERAEALIAKKRAEKSISEYKKAKITRNSPGYSRLEAAEKAVESANERLSKLAT
jgi:hypothetical protein